MAFRTQHALQCFLEVRKPPVSFYSPASIGFVDHLTILWIIFPSIRIVSLEPIFSIFHK